MHVGGPRLLPLMSRSPAWHSLALVGLVCLDTVARVGARFGCEPGAWLKSDGCPAVADELNQRFGLARDTIITCATESRSGPTATTAPRWRRRSRAASGRGLFRLLES